MTTALVSWDREDIASQCLVEPLLDDMLDLSKEDQRLELAVKAFAVEHIANFNELGSPPLTMGQLMDDLNMFMLGYERALRDLGMLKSRSDGGPHSVE